MNIEKQCEQCDKETNSEKDENGIVQIFAHECKFCERYFCHLCYGLHSCYGHAKEVEMCMWCNKEIWFKHEKPVYDQGDAFCMKDIIEQPWNKVNV